MKRKSLAFILALAMVFGNSASVLAANIEIEETKAVEDSDEIVIVSDEEEDAANEDSLQEDMASAEISSEEEFEIEISEENDIVIEDAAGDSSSATDVNADFTVNEADDFKLPPLTYKEVESDYPIVSPDVTADASFNANSNYTAAKYVTPNLPALRNQNPYGSCWAHSSIALAEISLITKGVATKNIDFSELHLAYFTYNSITDPLGGTEGDRNLMTYQQMTSSEQAGAFMDRGGNLSFSQNILASWLGAADESTAPYGSASAVLKEYRSTGKGLSDSVAFEDAAHMTHYFNVTMPNYLIYSGGEYVENPDFKDDFAAVKKLIVDYGAVGISYNAYTNYTVNGVSYSAYNSANNAFYSPAKISTNHAVIVVGWDDNFSRNNFNHTPAGDGAWLVRNSWLGDGYDDEYNYNGYFWMSYYDGSLDRTGYAFDFDMGANYQHNYQYDGAMDNSTTWGKKAANVFTVHGGSEAEALKAVSFATPSVDQNYTIEIYTNLNDDTNPTSGDLAATLTGKTDYQGYYTVPLEQPINLSEGTKFSVVVALSGNNNSEGYYTTEYGVSNNGVEYWYKIYSDAKEGQSFIYKTNYYGENGTWSDFGKNYGRNIRIKAFTDDAASIDTTGISLDKTSYSVEVGEEVTPIVTIAPSNASNKKFRLESSDSSIVRVDGKNLVGVKAGTATVTAISDKGNFKASATVTVAQSYTFVVKGENFLYKGDTSTYKVVTTPADAKIKQEIVFTSSNTDVLTIDSKTGVAKAVGAGFTTIKATIGKRSESFYVTVIPAAPVVSSKVDSDNTITLTWKHNQGTEYYEVIDDEANVLGGNIQPDAYGNCTYVDKRFVGKKVSKNDYAFYSVIAYEDGYTSQDTVQIIFNSKQYNVTYVLNGAKNNVNNPSTYYEGSYYNLYDATAPNGYVFEGWYTDSNFKGSRKTAITANDKKDLTLYAKVTKEATDGDDDEDIDDGEEEEDEGNIKYVLNGGTNNKNNPKSYTPGKTTKLLNPTKEGYTFGGWFTDSRFTGRKVTSISKNSKGKLTFYAKWTPIKYTVKFNKAGGNGSMASMKVEYGTKVALKTNTLKRKGFSFAGWNTKSNGAGESYTDGQVIYNLVNQNGKIITLYAQWEALPYTVKFDTNGGTFDGDKLITYYVTDKVKTIKLQKPVKDGYVFNGWYKQYSYGRYSGKVSQIYKNNAQDYTLYASWTEIKYTVKFNGNRATNRAKMNNLVKKSVVETVVLPENKFERKGYRFVGWNTKANGRGIFIEDEAELLYPEFITKNGQTVTLYAQWEAIN